MSKLFLSALVYYVIPTKHNRKNGARANNSVRAAQMPSVYQGLFSPIMRGHNAPMTRALTIEKFVTEGWREVS